eukprot:1304108-Rhodomonas_salina.1
MPVILCSTRGDNPKIGQFSKDKDPCLRHLKELCCARHWQVQAGSQCTAPGQPSGPHFSLQDLLCFSNSANT